MLVYELVQGGTQEQVCELALDGRLVQVYKLVLDDKLGQGDAQELDGEPVRDEWGLLGVLGHG